MKRCERITHKTAVFLYGIRANDPTLDFFFFLFTSVILLHVEPHGHSKPHGQKLLPVAHTTAHHRLASTAAQHQPATSQCRRLLILGQSVFPKTLLRSLSDVWRSGSLSQTVHFLSDGSDSAYRNSPHSTACLLSTAVATPCTLCCQ